MGLLVAVFAFGTTVTETVTREFPLSRDGRLSIENVNGNITVEQWDKEIVRIEAFKTAKGSSDESARKALQDAKVVFTSEDKEVSVSVKYPQSNSFFSFSWLFGSNPVVEVAFKVLAPSSTKVSLTSVNGEVAVSVKDAKVEAETVNGSVTVKDASLLSVSTVNGSIDFDTENLTKAESVNGQITGTVRSDKPKAASVEVVNGSITLKFPEKSAVTFSLGNVNGDISCDFQEVEGTKREKKGEVGGGGDTISVETVNGSIAVRKF